MVDANDVSNWRLTDEAASLSLVEVFPFSRRAHSLMVRSQTSAALHAEFMRISGAIEIMRGMDYHNDRYQGIVLAYTGGKYGNLNDLDHEVVAYLNRVGQFHSFAQSDFVVNTIGEASISIPTIVQLQLFRNKHTAHRSIDSPRGETPHHQVTQAMSLTPYMGRIYQPRSGVSTPPQSEINDLDAWRRARLESHVIVYQIQDSQSNVVDLALERDHPIVMTEAYSLIERILA